MHVFVFVCLFVCIFVVVVSVVCFFLVENKATFSNNCILFLAFKGYSTPGPCFLKLCAFSQKMKQLWTKYPMDLSEMFQGTQKSQFYFSKDHCCEGIVKNVQKSIFSMY